MNFKRRSLIMPQLPNLEEIGKITSKRKLKMLLSGLERQTMRVLHEAGWHQAVSMTLSPSVKNRVQVLHELQKEHNELKAKFFEEREALEAKYQKLYVPLYKKRFEIVNGVVEVESNMNKAKEVAEDKDKGDEAKGVPNFWVTAMKANEVLKDEIQEPDERALKYIKDIKWHRVDNPKGFKLQFHFHSNPYFSNSVLAKTYHMVDEDEIPKKAIVTEINWYPGRSLTQKVRYEMPKKDSNRKPVTKTENCRSFFNFFNLPQLPDEAVDLDKNTLKLLKNEMEHDYDIGSTIRDQIIPHADSWFTGEAVPAAELEDIGKDYIDVDEYDKEKHIKSLLDAGAKKRRAAVPKRAPECDLQLKLYDFRVFSHWSFERV